MFGSTRHPVLGCVLIAMAKIDSQLHLETVAVHAARRVDPATGAVAEPIHLSTTFQRGTDGEYPTGFSYSRSDNPNRAALEHALALSKAAQAARLLPGPRQRRCLQTLAPNDCHRADRSLPWRMRLLRTLFVPWDCVSISRYART
jgi:cystathionine gamma-synthase